MSYLPRKPFLTVGPSGTTGNDYTGNGTTDQTAIQAAVDAANTAGGGVVMLRRGSYTLTGGVTLATGVTIIGEGRGTTSITAAFNSSAAAGMFSISNKNDVSIEGIKFISNGNAPA